MQVPNQHEVLRLAYIDTTMAFAFTVMVQR